MVGFRFLFYLKFYYKKKKIKTIENLNCEYN